MHPRRKHVQIYRSKGHLFFTLFIVILPFLFLLLFARLTEITTSTLLEDITVSVLRLGIAYFIAAFLGWVTAVLFFRGKGSSIALPVFDVLQSVPLFAALPIATLYWGKTNLTVIVFLVLAIIWPVFFSVISSLKLIRHDWEEAVDIAGLKGWNYIKEFLWPVSTAGLITGSIIGLGEGWEALVATEIIVGIKSGVGNFFQLFSHNPVVTAFGIFGFLILIFAINKLVWLPLLEWSHHRMEE